MTALTDWSENALLTWLLDDAASPTRPTAWYVALHSADPGETGATGEITGGGYARQQVTGGFTIATNTATNPATLTFGPATGADWPSATHGSIWSASTGGNCLAKGALTAAKTAAVGDSITIAAGDLDVDLN